MHAPLLVFLYTDLHGTLAETRKIPHQPAGVIWPIVGAAHVDNISFVTADGFVDNDDDLTPAKACTTHLGSSITKHPSIMSPSKTTGFFFSILQGVMEPLLDEEEQDELDAMRPSLHDMEDDYAILAMRDGYAWIGSETHDFSPALDLQLFAPNGFDEEGFGHLQTTAGGLDENALHRATERVVVAVLDVHEGASAHHIISARMRIMEDLGCYHAALQRNDPEMGPLVVVSMDQE